MERAIYNADQFINRILKTNTDIRWIGYNEFFCYDDYGTWIAIVLNDRENREVPKYIEENNILF